MSAPLNVLFLCSGNSARGILAEALLNQLGRGEFKAYSAGSHPTGAVNPLALHLLERMNISIEGLRSKSWDEFAHAGAPHMDFIFTLCDKAAGEPCPVWPGHPATAHWGVENPAMAEGDEVAQTTAFRRAFSMMEHRIRLLLSLPRASLD